MKWVLTIVGGFLILMGVVWILQGFNVIPIGFMAGQMLYAVLGALLVVVGIGLLAFSRRHYKALTPPNDSASGRTR
jgi:hypothetical protein